MMTFLQWVLALGVGYLVGVAATLVCVVVTVERSIEET